MEAPIRCPSCQHEGTTNLFGIDSNGLVRCENSGDVFEFASQQQTSDLVTNMIPPHLDNSSCPASLLRVDKP